LDLRSRRPRAGYKGVNIDYGRLHMHRRKCITTFPVGGRRLLQQIDGYDATIVSGVVTQRHGAATGARPGRLVRGARMIPGSSSRPRVTGS